MDRSMSTSGTPTLAFTRSVRNGCSRRGAACCALNTMPNPKEGAASLRPYENSVTTCIAAHRLNSSTRVIPLSCRQWSLGLLVLWSFCLSDIENCPNRPEP